MLTIVNASDVKIGDAIPEADGYLFAVAAIERTGKLVTFRLVNEFSPERRVREDGLTLRKRASTRMYIVRDGGRDVAPHAVANALAAELVAALTPAPAP